MKTKIQVLCHSFGGAVCAGAVLLALCLPADTHATDGTALWTNVFSGAGNSDDRANHLAVDGSGDVVVTGYSKASGGNYDYATIKYSSAGVPVWTNRFNGAANRDDQPSFLAMDTNGNVYVTGYSTGIGSSYYCATIKYSSAGVPVWTNLFSSAGNSNAAGYSLAVDGSGNVVVAGRSWNGRNMDCATIKYSDAGVLLWAKLFNGAGNGDDQANSVAVDTNGDVVVTGITTGTVSNPDFTTIKYSGAGELVWMNVYSANYNSDDYAWFLAVDGSGNVVVTGTSTDQNDVNNYATIKYSSAGVPVWTNRFDGAGNGNDTPHSVTVDTNGNVYVTGSSTAVNGHTDYATIKYSSAGVPWWTNLFNGAANGNDAATSLALDGSGNVVVTGSSAGSGSSYEAVTIKYSSAGVPVWTNHWFNGAFYALAVDGSGNVVVTGLTTGSGGNYDYATIKYSEGGGGGGGGANSTPFSFVTTGDGFGFTNNQFRLTLTGPAGSNVVISASTDLQDWTPLATNPLGSGSLYFSDPQSITNALRFYRAQLSP